MNTRIGLFLTVLLLTVNLHPQTTRDTLGSHIIWSQTIAEASASTLDQAATDAEGDLWFISDPILAQPRDTRLVHVAADGMVVSKNKVPESINPAFPEVTDFALATSSAGQPGMIAWHSHSVGRTIYSDSADFALIEGGKPSSPTKIAGSGPEYQALVGLSDGHFLAMGDQSPLVLLKLNSAGKVEWKKRYPSNWVLPSGAAIKGGGACVLSSGYLAPWMHLMVLDDDGNITFQTRFSGRNGSVSPGPDGSCAVLYSTATTDRNRIRFHLALFDSSLKEKWSTTLPAASYVGASFHLASLTDGWVVVTDAFPGVGVVSMARYDVSGRAIWSFTDNSVPHLELLAASADSFYLICDGEDRSTIIIKGR